MALNYKRVMIQAVHGSRAYTLSYHEDITDALHTARILQQRADAAWVAAEQEGQRRGPRPAFRIYALEWVIDHKGERTL